MKSRSAPRPLRYGPRQALAHDPQVRKWVKRLLSDPEATPSELGEEQLVFVYNEVLKRRGEQFDQSLFERAMADTCPVIAAPKFTDTAGDLRLMFELPEVRELWHQWTGPVGERGPRPNYAAAKALMVVMAMAGKSAHADDVHEQLASSNWLTPLFEELERERLALTASSGFDEIDAPAAGDSAEPASGSTGPVFSAGGYSTVMRLIPKLGASGARLAMAANVALVRSLRELLPDAGIGKRLLIDGSMVPAWCQQKGAGNDEEREERLRRHTPEAGFRAYMQTGSEKRPVKPGDTLASGLRAGRGKAWRGYYLVVISDQATGLPLVWNVQDAATDEAAAIVPLLSDLHRLWPDINADCIAGDSAWDEDAWCRLCEVDYGIHPIFRLHGKPVTKAVQEGESRDGSVAAYTHDGRLVCSQHNKPMAYGGADTPSRDGLKPGQSNDEGRFRLRGICDHDGPGVPPSKPGLRMKTDWSKLTFYPHHTHGNARRYAQRQAMLARLNQAESLFNRVKAGRKLATPGAARPRLRDKDSVDALLSLALLSMTALTVVDQRQQHAAPGPRRPEPPHRPRTATTAPAPAPAMATAAGAIDVASPPTAAALQPAPAPSVVRRRGHLTLIAGGAG